MTQTQNNKNAEISDAARDHSSENALRMMPDPIKQGCIALAIIVIVTLVWHVLFRSNNDGEQKTMADIEHTDSEAGVNATDDRPNEKDLPIQVHETDSEQSLPVAKPLPMTSESMIPDKVEEIERQLAQFQDRLDQVGADHETQQQAQDQTIRELQAQLTAQALQIQQLQQRLKPPKPAARKPVKRDKPVAAPFTLVSIDQWGFDVYAILRHQGQLHELTTGQTLAGWRIDSIDAKQRSVTVIHSPSGRSQTLFMQFESDSIR